MQPQYLLRMRSGDPLKMYTKERDVAGQGQIGHI